jgi:hypothetical protein
MATERVLNEYCSTIATPGVSSAKWVRWAIPSPDGRYIALNIFSTVRNVWFVENF